ncbi:MAG: GC-type dockerin domain-anchored protein [Planctomycetota bacterium]
MRAVLAIVAAAGVAAPVAAQLANGSFETAGSGSVFADWAEFNTNGMNVVQDMTFPSDGMFHAKVFGTFSDDGMMPPSPTQNDTVLQSSDVAVSQGDIINAQVDWATPSDDKSVGGLAVMTIELRDADGILLETRTEVFLDDNSDADVYNTAQVQFTASPGAATARMVLVYVQLAEDPRGGSVFFDNAQIDVVGFDPLINGSFEVGGPGPLSEYTLFSTGENIPVDAQVLTETIAPRTGMNHLKIFGDFSPFGTSQGLFQDVIGVPGNTYEATTWAYNDSGDAIGGMNQGFLALEFRDSNGSLISEFPVNTLAAGESLDTYTQFTSGPQVAPAGTAIIRYVVGYNQDDNFGGGAVYYDDCALIETPAGRGIAGTDVLNNGGFEPVVGAATFLGWEETGNTAVPPNINAAGDLVNDGSLAAKMFGPFNVDGMDNPIEGVAGLFQSVPAVEGDEWEASVQAAVDFFDLPDVDVQGFMSLLFLDGSGNVLADNSVNTLGGDDFTFDTYVPFSVTAIAPAGTAEAQIFLGLSQPAATFRGGSIFYDTAQLELITPGGPTCVPDITTDGANPGDAGYLVPDGAVTVSDLSTFVELWLASDTAVADITTDGANPGDASYLVPDGFVTVSDLSTFVELWLAGCP